MTGIGLARVIMEGIAQVVAVLVWPVLLGFVLWLFQAPLGGLIDALTARLRGGGGSGASHA